MSEEAVIALVAEYQLLGDVEGRTWMTSTLGLAQADGKIVGFNVTGSYPGQYGIELVTFVVCVRMQPQGRFYPSMTFAEAKNVGTDLLNEIIGDSDVEVRWVSPMSA